MFDVMIDLLSTESLQLFLYFSARNCGERSQGQKSQL
jgi:hypothetical protein